MPARTGHTYTVPGKSGSSGGVVNTKKHTYTGSGSAPGGTTKVAEPSYTEVPTTTTYPSGKVTTSGYGSKSAAAAAKRRARATRRKVRVLTAPKKTSPQKGSQRVTPTPVLASLKTKETKRPSPVPAPTSKPQVFQGKKTAGAPSLKSLQVASKSGGLKVNKAGFVTTPKIRRVAGEVKTLRAKARKSTAPLPGLTQGESRNARVVLNKGRKAKASKKEMLAAAETGLVESSFKNLPTELSDGTSAGWRQETEQERYGPESRRRKPGPTAEDYFAETAAAGRGKGQTAGQLAQTVQGSAYPERYDQRKPEAAALLAAYKKGGLKPAQAKKLKQAEAQASKLGLKTAKPSAGPPPKKVVTRYKASVAAEKQLEKAHLPYVWGGGHNAGKVEPGSGLDCSGTVSYVLQHMGVKLPGGVVSGEMGRYLKPGPGAVTVFYNSEHTFLYDAKAGKYFGTSESNPGGGAGFFPKSVGDSEVASGNSAGAYSVGHVSGLGKKQAVQLGAIPGSFPGMKLSSSGTSATIEPGAGATVSKPGFSAAPIRLTPAQEAKRKLHKLDQLSAGKGTPTYTTAESAPSTSELSRLEAKYGAAA